MACSEALGLLETVRVCVPTCQLGGCLNPLCTCYLHVAYRITKRRTVFVVCEDNLLSVSFLVWLQQTRIGLSLFDIQGLGYLKESVRKCSLPYTRYNILILC